MSTYSGQGLELPMSASGDLDAVQYRFVRPAQTSRFVLQANGASNPYTVGVLQNDPRNGEAANVRTNGTTLLYMDCAASAVVYGGLITSSSVGLGIPQGSTSGSAPALGMVISGGISSGCGILAEVLLFGPVGIKVGAS